ncbi:hypothetical protein NDU88_000071 [Pleurodeles waltl]|uniref:Uncharacterized protein n=1 Tax=Pleurodeles waltl TaxID=8319 RepID=A0AAV7MGT4_PLEWA|nr:hypothetical protein NDU88_000071 [Pleurodeles waltl]
MRRNARSRSEAATDQQGRLQRFEGIAAPVLSWLKSLSVALAARDTSLKRGLKLRQEEGLCAMSAPALCQAPIVMKCPEVAQTEAGPVCHVSPLPGSWCHVCPEPGSWFLRNMKLRLELGLCAMSALCQLLVL